MKFVLLWMHSTASQIIEVCFCIDFCTVLCDFIFIQVSFVLHIGGVFVQNFKDILSLISPPLPPPPPKLTCSV